MADIEKWLAEEQQLYHMSASFVFVYFLSVSASVCLFWLAEEQQLYHMLASFVFVYFLSVSASVCLLWLAEEQHVG